MVLIRTIIRLFGLVCIALAVLLGLFALFGFTVADDTAGRVIAGVLAGVALLLALIGVRSVRQREQHALAPSPVPKSPAVRDLGRVVKDPESFRYAGSKVFTKAQYRMEVIARTEVLRAHNQGRLKFHDQVGVRKLEWMTMEDERVCPVCGPLDGKVFDTNRFPQQPAHPNCRCTSVVAWPLAICGGELGAKAAAEPAACIIPPQTIEEQAKAKAAEDAKLKAAFEGGQIADLNTLSAKQLQTLAKQNGVSIARTKTDFIKLLDAAEPGVDHSG